MTSPFHTRSEVRIDAVRPVVGLIRKLASKFGGFAGSASMASDPTCDHLAGLDAIPPLVTGTVVRSGIGSYDCEVQTFDGRVIVCAALSPVLSDVYGVSQSCTPVPGSHVLVYVQSVGLSRQRVATGVILGVLPKNNTGGVSATGESVLKKIADTEYPEGGVAQFTEAGPAAVASDTEYMQKGDFQCGRPHDLVPGEYALTGHSGAGLFIGAVSTCVKGSEAASIRCSALDDQVRIISGHFRHINAAGSEEIFNDGGFISIESAVSLYQPERLGVKSEGTAAFDWKTGDPLSLKELKSCVEQKSPRQTAKKRFYRYAGYLGDIVNVFVANPDPNTEIEDMENPGQDQGLFHTHLDTSGRFTMRSASGILLERYDRIPIPKRKHYAWDPAGDKAEQGDPEEKERFTLEDHPMGIGVTLGDMAAWWNHLSYLRFSQFKTDFTVPDQKELKCPQDEYDEIGKGRENFQEYDTRHSYVGLTPDGGIVLRDAWGSEIIMADGRITLNAAANIEIRSGSSVVILGGDDVVAKAYNSLDLSATKKDIRIKAENNLQVVAVKRGVLIQSKAENAGSTPNLDDVGEDLQSAGVIIKADESNISLVGKNTAVQGIDGVSLSSFDEDGQPKGNVVLAGKQVSTVASDMVTSTAGGVSGVIVSEQSAILCAPTVLAVGGQSAAEVAGNNMLLGIPVEVGSAYSQTIAICKSQVQQYLESVDWLNPLPPTAFSQVDFRFRTTQQYGTETTSGMSGGVFSVYEPSWALLTESERKWMKECKLKTWDEEKDAAGGYPWPGEKAQNEGYFTYQEQNVDKASGVEQPKSSKAVLTKAGFSSYHIRDRK